MASQEISTMQEIQDSYQLALSWQLCWNSEGVIHVDFLPRGITVTMQITVTRFEIICTK
jgi:hypothetical protein